MLGKRAACEDYFIFKMLSSWSFSPPRTETSHRLAYRWKTTFRIVGDVDLM